MNCNLFMCRNDSVSMAYQLALKDNFQRYAAVVSLILEGNGQRKLFDKTFNSTTGDIMNKGKTMVTVYIIKVTFNWACL